MLNALPGQSHLEHNHGERVADDERSERGCQAGPVAGQAKGGETARRAARDLLRALQSLQPLERFPDSWREWTELQLARRSLPAGKIAVSGAGVSVAGAVAGREQLVARWRQLALWDRAHGWKTAGVGFPPSDEELQRCEADLPEAERSRILRGLPEPSIERSWADVRAEIVAPVRESLPTLLEPAIAAVLAAGGSAEPLRALERDPLMHADTVAAAVAELHRAVPQRRDSKAGRDQSQSLQANALAVVGMFEDPDSGHYRPGWTHADVAGVLGRPASALNGKQRDGTYRLPDYMRRYKQRGADVEERRRRMRQRTRS